MSSGPELDYIIICDHAFPDFQGKMSTIGIFDTISVPTLPATHTQLFTVARIRGEPGTSFKSQIRILDPTDQVLNESPPAPVQMRSSGHFHMYVVRPLEVSIPGRYLVQVLLDGRVAGSTPLIVKQKKPNVHEVPKADG
jgi:hypothetical protein